MIEGPGPQDELGGSGSSPGFQEESPVAGAESSGALEAILARAERFGEEGDYDGMAELLREALEDYPTEASVLCFLGVAERELGLEGVAYERFRQALALEPQDPFILATAGNALAAFADPDAEQALRAAAVLAPELPLARWLYGAFLAREGFPDEARRELDAAVELAPDHSGIAYESGIAWALAGKPDQALHELARAVELDPADGWARIVVALLLIEDDRVDEALTEIELGAREREEDVEAQLLAALVYGAEGYDDEALEFLERGRMRAQGTDSLAADAVDEQLETGHESARRFLREEFSPSLLRERLQARP
jgi:tetratricopeptide (TPR) repeat protein